MICIHIYKYVTDMKISVFFACYTFKLQHLGAIYGRLRGVLNGALNVSLQIGP